MSESESGVTAQISPEQAKEVSLFVSGIVGKLDEPITEADMVTRWTEALDTGNMAVLRQVVQVGSKSTTFATDTEMLMSVIGAKLAEVDKTDEQAALGIHVALESGMKKVPDIKALFGVGDQRVSQLRRIGALVYEAGYPVEIGLKTGDYGRMNRTNMGDLGKLLKDRSLDKAALGAKLVELHAEIAAAAIAPEADTPAIAGTPGGVTDQVADEPDTPVEHPDSADEGTNAATGQVSHEPAAEVDYSGDFTPHATTMAVLGIGVRIDYLERLLASDVSETQDKGGLVQSEWNRLLALLSPLVTALTPVVPEPAPKPAPPRSRRKTA